MEANKHTCGYCGKDIASEECGTLTLKDKTAEVIKEIEICRDCSKRIELIINLTKYPKEDIKAFNDFLSRNRK